VFTVENEQGMFGSETPGIINKFLINQSQHFGYISPALRLVGNIGFKFPTDKQEVLLIKTIDEKVFGVFTKTLGWDSDPLEQKENALLSSFEDPSVFEGGLIITYMSRTSRL
jgi:hypothetical protein